MEKVYTENLVAEYSKLILFSEGKKNLTAIAKKSNLSVGFVCKQFQATAQSIESVRKDLKHLSTLPFSSIRYLIMDDTVISKEYAKKIERTGKWKDLGRRSVNGLTYLTSIITDGHTAMPYDSMLYTAKALKVPDYKTKSDMAHDIVTSAEQDHKIERLLADAHYSTKALIPKLIDGGTAFLMKFTSTKNVEIGKKTKQIREFLKLRKNEHSKTVHGIFAGVLCSFHVIRIAKDVIHYFISNDHLDRETLLKLYKIRWKIEPMHRTVKQMLGIRDCMMRKKEKQQLHVLSVMQAYAVASLVMKFHGFKTIEDAIRYVREVKPTSISSLFKPLGESDAYDA